MRLRVKYNLYTLQTRPFVRQSKVIWLEELSEAWGRSHDALVRNINPARILDPAQTNFPLKTST